MNGFAIVVTTAPDNAAALRDNAIADGRERRLADWALEVIEPDMDARRVQVAYHNTQLDVELYLPGELNAVPLDNRRKRILIADMESTIIEQEMLDELADVIGIRDRVAEITERAMRGEVDFDTAITERVALLGGLDAGVLDEVARTRLSYMPGARELVATMKSQGAYCALVSGGFTYFTAKVAAELGFDEHRANTLEVADGKLTGRVVPPILGRDAKVRALHEVCGRLGLSAADAVAVGDGANDLGMLEAAGLGVAYRAKPQVRERMAIHDTGAVVNHCDLRALLYLQGLSSADVVHNAAAPARTN